MSRHAIDNDNGTNDEDVFTSLVSFTGDTLGLTPAGEGEFFGLYEDGADLIDLVVGE